MSDLAERIVTIVRSERPDYGPVSRPAAAPELPGGQADTMAQVALRELFLAWGLDAGRAGTAEWNPLAEFAPPGARVLIKPNWVLHWNQSGASMDCMITHASVIEAILEYVSLTHPGSVVVGDAPLQGCDFEALCQAGGVHSMIRRFQERGLPLRVADFRRTVLLGAELGAHRLEDRRALDRYVLFDLGQESLLEAHAADADKFRVTMYNPDLLRRTHSAGRHQYLIAREALESDLVINVPKLKCHRKSGVTGALKNLVGINGNKEFLPHHRKGGAGAGGDCYAGRSRLKRKAEDLLDAANRRQPGMLLKALVGGADVLSRLAALTGEDSNLEGGWYGNDTVWRMVLDLQRILRYGREDARLAAEPQRRVIHITDAIVAGEREGPLAPTPVPSGFLTGASNAAAAEWVHSRLMGFDPGKIPLVKEAFRPFRFPLVSFLPGEIEVRLGPERLAVNQVRPLDGRAFVPSRGWQGHCELDTRNDHMGEPALVA